MRIAPTYRLYTWRQIVANDTEIRYRPTFFTFLRRLAFTAVCFLIAGLWVWGHSQMDYRLSRPVDFSPAAGTEQRAAEAEREAREAFGDVLSEEQLDKIVREVEAERAQRAAATAAEEDRYNRVRRVLLYVYRGIVGFFVVIGILPPLTCLWSRVTIRRTPAGEILIRSFTLFPRTLRCRVDEFYAIRTFVMERYGFNRYGRINAHNWAWYVQLSHQGQPSMPMHGSAGVTFGRMGPQFHVYQEKHQPSLIGKAPEPVRELVKGLRTLTGLKAEQPQLIEGQVVGRGKVKYSASLREEIPGKREEYVFKPGEPVPDHIQARIDALRTSENVEQLPDGGMRAMQRKITIRDQDGVEVVYNRLEDVPEDLRRRLGL